MVAINVSTMLELLTHRMDEGVNSTGPTVGLSSPGKHHYNLDSCTVTHLNHVYNTPHLTHTEC